MPLFRGSKCGVNSECSGHEQPLLASRRVLESRFPLLEFGLLDWSQSWEVLACPDNVINVHPGLTTEGTVRRGVPLWVPQM